MTNDYRTSELSRSQAELDAAYSRLNTARTQKSRREAAEDIEFWSSKTAFLSNPKISS